MKFGEAFTLALSLKKDIVLRNHRVDPPVAKIMNYKLELLKKLFKKLGKDVGKKDEKSKSIRLTRHELTASIEGGSYSNFINIIKVSLMILDLTQS